MEEELPYKNLGIENLPDEEWKWIDGYEDRYQVSNMGRIKSFTQRWDSTPIIKKQGISGLYPMIGLVKEGKTKTHLVHRLVGIAFVENPLNYPQINHRFGIKRDNRHHQLEWGDQQQNIIHAFEHGLSKTGEDHGMSKITNDDALYIFNSKESRNVLAERFGLCVATIKSIKNGTTWTEVTGKSYGRAKNKTHAGLSDQDVLDIFNSSEKISKLALQYQISNVSIRNIKSGLRWGYLTGKTFVPSEKYKRK